MKTLRSISSLVFMNIWLQRFASVKPEDLTFENVIEPFLTEEEQVLYAFHTLWTRMLTDWPSSRELHADFMKVIFAFYIFKLD